MQASKSLIGASNFQIMRALMLKDWRLFRLPTIGLVVAGVVPHLLFAGAEQGSQHYRRYLLLNALDASYFALFLTALLASTFGGVALAGERSERTADFIALLPVSRGQIVASKITVAFCVLGAFIAFYALLPAFLWGLNAFTGFASLLATGALAAGSAVSFFGVAWLVSTVTASAVISAGISIALTIGVLAWTTLRILMNQYPHYGTNAHLYGELRNASFALGLASLIIGTIYYLRRIAP